jgi:outer membrane protein OmpA-like peptidoglycan-associated protein
MRLSHAAGLTAIIAASACAAQQAAPKSLVDARADVQRAHDGAAARLAPTEVHEADLALQRAEQAWQDAPDDPSTVDLAIAADRRALLAQSEAAYIKAERDAEQARNDLKSLAVTELQATRGQLKDTQGQLKDTQGQLGQTEQRLGTEQQVTAAQRARMAQLEASLKDARDTIAKIASVKDDSRGMVITLQGEVLFQTGKAELKPGAIAKLDQIAQALKGAEQPIVVFGFTDNVGAHDMNMGLSQRRADAVRDYLAGHGIPSDLISAKGMGPDQPVADNASVEGRAQNRRVEIVVQPKPQQQ